MAYENEKKEVVTVKVRSKSTVFLNKKPERQECPLVTFDLPYVTFYYNQKLLLYRGECFEEMVEKLKEGLGIVLEYFYPLAGKLGKDEEGVLKVESCGDRGVEVVVAVAEGLRIEELAKDEAPSLLEKIVPYTGVMNLEGFDKPLLAVQITKLKDGVALGCAFNHAILDGTSTWHFMSSWAETCRGSSTISSLPFHDRAKARDTRVKLLPPGTDIDGHTNGDNRKLTRVPLREKIFHVPGETIEKMKAEVNSNRASDAKPFSAFQSLGVHIWHAVTRARQLPLDAYTVFTIFADCRKRLDPPMPESYFGNLIQAIFTVLPAGMLLEQPLDFGAGLMQKVIDEHTAEAIDARSREWESAPKLFEFKDAGINCVAVGSSPRFKVYEVDFGWGKPENVRSGSNNKFDGMVYLYAGREGGRSVDVEITLTPKAMENLENDPKFLKVDI